MDSFLRPDRAGLLKLPGDVGLSAHGPTRLQRPVWRRTCSREVFVSKLSGPPLGQTSQAAG